MKYAILTTSNSRNAGGLCGAIAGITCEANKTEKSIELISYDDEFTTEDWLQYGRTINHPYKRVNAPLLSSFGYSSDLDSVLKDMRPKVIDVQGLWMYHSWAALKYQKKHPEVKKVITPHGMLDPWAVNNSGWKKKLVGHLFEYENLRTADCFHALCKSEYDSIRKFGLNNPVAIIPNGINLPVNPVIDRNKEKKVLLYISRIHPKKGVKELIEGVAIIKDQRPDLLANWTIRIAGWNQNGHQEELQALCDAFGLKYVVNFIGPVFGYTKEKELCQADAFILPSYSEGLPMSILEAWAYKLPCVMTNFCNLPEGFEAEAAIRIEPSSNSVADGLVNLMQMTDETRISMGERGYELCKQRFTWKVVSEMKLQMYQWLLGECAPTKFIIIG